VTFDREKAHVYTVFQAQALARIFWEETVYTDRTDEQGVWVEHSHTPDPRLSPRRTQAMKEKNHVWVAYEGVWLAAHVRDLLAVTMAVSQTEPVQAKGLSLV
jgi:hypothetical protein